MIIKAYLSFIISLCLLATTITPAFATLPNEAVFNWVEYKFADLFPKSQTVKSELTHEGVHYDLRSWAGAWGTRYLGITDDGEIIGLGDYTDGELLSFGYIDNWADAILADAEAVVNRTSFDVSYIVSETPPVSLDVAGTVIYDSLSMIPIKGYDNRNRFIVHPTYYYEDDNPTDFPPYEFIEDEPGSDRYVLNDVHSEVGTSMVRNFKIYKHNDYTALYLADTGKERHARDENNVWEFGDIFVAKDYGDGFEYQKINEYKAFYHSIDAYDIDGNGYEDIAAVNMGVYGGPFEHDSIHLYMQYNEGEYTQVQFAPGYEIGTSTGSLRFADLDNDGKKELIQSAYTIGSWTEFNYGSFKIWKLNEDNQYEEHTVVPRQGLWAEADYGCARTKVFDFNNDGLLDILFFMERSGVQGIELYVNEGNLQFRRVTDEVLPLNDFTAAGLATRDFDLVDVNNDGFTDIILNLAIWDSSEVQSDDGLTMLHNDAVTYDLGEAIWLNADGEKFIKQGDRDDLSITIPDVFNYTQSIKFSKAENGEIEFIGLTANYGEGYSVTSLGFTPIVFNVKVQ